jgi:hypothetical protein
LLVEQHRNHRVLDMSVVSSALVVK